MSTVPQTADAIADLPEISLAAYEKLDQWRDALERTPRIDCRVTFEAAVEEIYAEARRESDPISCQAVVDAIYILGEEHADLDRQSIELMLIGAEARWSVSHANGFAADLDPVRLDCDARPGVPSVANVASVAPPWPRLDDSALYGIAGDIVRTIEPHSEADPVALLIQALTFAGNVIGRSPYYAVESDHHHANLFVVLVGDTAKARKGTWAGRIRAIAKQADQSWNDDRVKSGLSSGEGLINEVRDAVQRWDSKAQSSETVDPGVIDKRLLVVEPEFAGALAVAERHGNTLSPTIRRAWDGDKLSTLTKNSPLTATGSHISIVGHITAQELRERIARTDIANGFANRFLFAMVRRSKELPFGGQLTDSQILELGDRLKDAVVDAQILGRVTMTDAACRKWAAVYPSLSGGQDGLLGAITARAEAQVVRLALLYALLDGQTGISEVHLTAALALWEYCEASVAFIWGELARRSRRR